MDKWKIMVVFQKNDSSKTHLQKQCLCVNSKSPLTPQSRKLNAPAFLSPSLLIFFVSFFRHRFWQQYLMGKNIFICNRFKFNYFNLNLITNL